MKIINQKIKKTLIVLTVVLVFLFTGCNLKNAGTTDHTFVIPHIELEKSQWQVT